jgi:flagella synthesis protein FlgN
MIEKTFPIAEKLLNNGLMAAQRLLELLHGEADILSKKVDPEALTLMVAKKKEVVVLLEEFSKQLGQVLATEKLTADHSGIEQYLLKAQLAGINIGESRGSWANITALSKKCRTLNEQNGAGIELLSRHTQRALQIVKGKSPQVSTYGRDGAARSEQFSHRLISV